MNALLDEASTKMYLNADVAAELGLQGRIEQKTVNILNEQIEIFETKPVSFELLSVDRKVKMNVTAYTANTAPSGHICEKQISLFLQTSQLLIFSSVLTV